MLLFLRVPLWFWKNSENEWRTVWKRDERAMFRWKKKYACPRVREREIVPDIFPRTYASIVTSEYQRASTWMHQNGPIKGLTTGLWALAYQGSRDNGNIKASIEFKGLSADFLVLLLRHWSCQPFSIILQQSQHVMLEYQVQYSDTSVVQQHSNTPNFSLSRNHQDSNFGSSCWNLHWEMKILTRVLTSKSWTKI